MFKAMASIVESRNSSRLNVISGTYSGASGARDIIIEKDIKAVIVVRQKIRSQTDFICSVASKGNDSEDIAIFNGGFTIKNTELNYSDYKFHYLVFYEEDIVNA